MAKRKLKTLSLKEKVRIIAAVEENVGVKRKKDIAREFGIPPNTLSTILSNKDKIKHHFEQCGSTSSSKRVRQSDYPEIEEALVEWLQQIRTSHSTIPINGATLREKALSFAGLFGRSEFGASSGWLDRFKARHKVLFKSKCVDKVVPEMVCSEWVQSKSLELLNEYPERDIFNIDETSLFYKCMLNMKMIFKGELCSGEKENQEKITILIGANMDGTEKLSLLVVGKAKSPRCLKNVLSLPVDYESNKNASMTGAIFESYVRKLDDKMHSQKRKIVLLVSSCPSHSNLNNLKAVRMEFLWPNTTATYSLQPLGQGIIKNLKFHYRKRLVETFIEKIERTEQQQQMTTILDAIRTLNIVWDKDIKPIMIVHCFKKAGFIRPNENSEISANNDKNPEEPNWELLANPEVSFDECDDSVEVYEELSDEDTAVEITQLQLDSSDEDNQYEVAFPTNIEAMEAFRVVQCYVEGQPNVPEQIFTALNKVENFIDGRKKDKKQSNILDYFSR